MTEKKRFAKSKGLIKNIAQNKTMYIMFLPAIIMLFFFCYMPMFGLILAFKEYRIRLGFFDSPIISPLFKNFTDLLSNPDFLKVTVNTLRLSAFGMLICFPTPIIFALLLNEVRSNKYKRTVQTIVYLPHFLSWIVLSGILITIFSYQTGIFNEFLRKMNIDPVPFFTNGNWFIVLLITSGLWKEIGWSTIIYLAALAGVDPQLYEAAMLDGAGRWQRLKHITLPGIAPAISITLILSLPGILGSNFDQIINLYTPMVYDKADVIDTYIYRVGVLGGKFEMATALGLVRSAIGFLLIVISNKAAKAMGGSAIW